MGGWLITDLCGGPNVQMCVGGSECVGICLGGLIWLFGCLGFMAYQPLSVI